MLIYLSQKMVLIHSMPYQSYRLTCGYENPVPNRSNINLIF